MDLKNLKPLEKNPFKAKNDDQILKIAKSIESFAKMMEMRPIVIDETFQILAGNKRFFACKLLGMKTIPDAWVLQRNDLTEDEKKEFIVKDNAHFGSEWDFAILEEWQVPQITWGVIADVPIDINMEDFKRPEFKAETPECEKDEKYFYVEFYKQDEKYNKLKEILGENCKRNALDADWFYELITSLENQ